MNFRNLLSRWNAFWFSSHPPHLLSIFRILFTLVFLYRITNYFGPEPLWGSSEKFYFGHLFYVPYFEFLKPPSYAVFSLLLDLRLLFALLALVGLVTPFSLIAAGSIHLYLFFLNQGFYSHHLYFLGIQALLCGLMPCGKTLSCDSLLRRRQGQEPPALVPYPAVRLLQVAVSLIYLFSALSKSHPVWLSGEALQSYYETQRIIPTGLLGFLGKIPYSLQAWAVVLIEYFLSIGLWLRPTRVAALIVGVVFHLLMNATMSISSFSHQMIVSYLLFLNPQGPFLQRGGGGDSEFNLRLRNRLKELFSIDYRSLGLFRIGAALILICDLILRAVDLTAHYTDRGILPRSLLTSVSSGHTLWSFHLMSGEGWLQGVLFFVTGISAVVLLAGYRTRLATFLCWLLLLSLHFRNPKILEGSDILLRMLLFWSLFIPLGARYSWDSLSKPPPSGAENRIFSLGTAGLLLQVAFIYFFTALHKSGVEWRVEGSAIYYALQNDWFVTPFGRFFLQFPSFLKFLTFSVLAFEFLAPFLLFCPFWTGPVRTLLVAGFIFMQLGFGLSLRLGIFPWVSSVAMIPFLPSWFWQKISIRRGLLQPFLGKVSTFIQRRTFGDWISLGSNGLAAFFIVYIFFWLVASVEKSPIQIPFRYRQLGWLLGIDQRWTMFSPRPMKVDGWFVIPGRLGEGSAVDLYRGAEPVKWERPPVVSETYKNQRWRRYMKRIYASKRERALYAKYLCRHWNAQHKGGQRLKSLEIYFMKEKTLPHGQVTGPEKVRFGTYSCVTKKKMARQSTNV